MARRFKKFCWIRIWIRFGYVSKFKSATTEIFFNGVPNMTAHEDATRQVGRSNRQTYVHSKGPGVSSRKTGVFFSEVQDFKFKNVVKNVIKIHIQTHTVGHDQGISGQI